MLYQFTNEDIFLFNKDLNNFLQCPSNQSDLCWQEMRDAIKKKHCVLSNSK